MEKYLKLFAALERIFGKGYVSRLMGKQSNVITLPDKQARKFLDTELNIMEASEGAVKKGVQDLNNLVSDTKRLSTLNDQELLTITNNAERLAFKVNPPAPPPAPTAKVLSITTKVDKNKDPNVLIDEYNKNQTRLRLTDNEGGTAISYNEFRKLQSRNNEIEKTLESLNVKPALDEVKPEGIVIPFTKKTEDFATGGRVEMVGGGVSQGLDYLSGIERRGYVGGGRIGFKKGSLLIDAAKNLIKKKSKKDVKRQMTREEIENFADEYGIDPRDEYYTFDGTLADAKRILKESEDEYAYMYQQYKMGKLNPVAGEKTQDRLNFLRKKAEEAEMTSDKRLFSINEMKELKDLEKTFSPMGTSNRINISDPKTAESFTEFAKQNDPEGFKKIQKIVDDINNKNTLENFDITGRKKNAKGGLNYLMGL